ncbi:MAG: alpha-L-fucosidase [Acutalibacteraceae bacterium]
MVVRKLVECVSKGGNMILNVGPDANGRFPGAGAAQISGRDRRVDGSKQLVRDLSLRKAPAKAEAGLGLARHRRRKAASTRDVLEAPAGRWRCRVLRWSIWRWRVRRLADGSEAAFAAKAGSQQSLTSGLCSPSRSARSRGIPRSAPRAKPDIRANDDRTFT